MNRNRISICAVLTTALGLLVAAPVQAAWQNTYSFGATLKGDLYTPSKLGTPPGILVAIHMCTGHSSTVHGWFDSYADKTGFYIIAPDAGKQCFDSSASRDGDKAAIVTMVDAVVKLGGDKDRVFAAGMSSGGCMTNTLLAVYPDVFAGGSAMPGFPAGGWPAGDTTCTKCGSSPPSTDGKYWGDIARKAYSFSGTYPCSQQWVGGGDEYNFNGWLPAVAAQFQNLGSLSSGTSATGRSGWTRTVYKDASGNVRLETNLGPTSQKHDLETVSPTLYGDVITFLGLDNATGACGIASTGAGGASGSVDGSTGSGGSGGNKDGSADGANDASGDVASTSGSGGATGNGGSTGSGGNVGSGGSKASGGASGSGGSSSGTGGKSGNGGSSGTGGSQGSGGSASGGSSSSGGSNAKGGSNGSGGSGSGGSSTSGNGSSGGCSFAMGGATSSREGLIVFLIAGVGLVLRRRRSTRQ